MDCYNLYICEDVMDIIWDYYYKSIHKDNTEYLINEITSCLIPINTPFGMWGEYVAWSDAEKKRKKIPTNITCQYYDVHNSIVTRIKDIFYVIQYYQYIKNKKKEYK